MTCKELQCYLENPMRVDIYMFRESLPKPVSEHLASCPDCRLLFAEQKTLGISLNVLRNSAPEIPASIETAVFANYRRQLARQESSGTTRKFPTGWLAWGFVAAVVILVATILFTKNKSSETTPAQSPVAISAPESAPTIAEVPPAVIPPPKSVVAKAARVAKSPVIRPKATVANSNTGFPPGFARLVYCDAISCAGALEVIRVELPAPAVSSAPGSAQAAVPVMADVLVGADGIARGIRIVR